jgi:hypothetical protein
VTGTTLVSAVQPVRSWSAGDTPGPPRGPKHVTQKRSPTGRIPRRPKLPDGSVEGGSPPHGKERRSGPTRLRTPV